MGNTEFGIQNTHFQLLDSDYLILKSFFLSTPYSLAPGPWFSRSLSVPTPFVKPYPVQVDISPMNWYNLLVEKTMNTRLLDVKDKDRYWEYLQEAAEALRSGEVVAFPTEIGR